MRAHPDGDAEYIAIDPDRMLGLARERALSPLAQHPDRTDSQNYDDSVLGSVDPRPRPIAFGPQPEEESNPWVDTRTARLVVKLQQALERRREIDVVLLPHARQGRVRAGAGRRRTAGDRIDGRDGSPCPAASPRRPAAPGAHDPVSRL